MKTCFRGLRKANQVAGEPRKISASALARLRAIRNTVIIQYYGVSAVWDIRRKSAFGSLPSQCAAPHLPQQD